MNVLNKAKFFAEIGYTPHPKQRLYHNSKARFRMPCCGRRFGKSRMAGTDLEPELMLPNRRFWIVGPDYSLGEKEFRVIWDDLIIKLGLGRDKRVKKAYSIKQGHMYIELPWGSRVEVKSADHPESLVGDALDGVIMSEAAKHKMETWERFIRPALADRRGWATFPTTPEGHNWYYNLWLMGLNADFEDYEAWRFPSWDNPHVYPGGRDDPEIRLLERTSSTYEWFLQEISAEFTAFVGKIYSEFDESKHVRNHRFNPDWPNYVFMDFGFVHPFAAIEVQIDPQDNVYVWREHVKSYQTLDVNLREMQERNHPEGYHIDYCFGDAADPEAVMRVNQFYAPCIALPEAKENWRRGIELTKRFLREYDTGETVDEFGTPEMAPKLFIDPSCTDTIRQMSNYRTQKNANSAVKETSSRSVAHKEDDDCVDALRYGLMHVFELGATSHLADVYDDVLKQTVPETGYFTADRMVF